MHRIPYGYIAAGALIIVVVGGALKEQYSNF